MYYKVPFLSLDNSTYLIAQEEETIFVQGSSSAMTESLSRRSGLRARSRPKDLNPDSHNKAMQDDSEDSSVEDKSLHPQHATTNIASLLDNLKLPQLPHSVVRYVRRFSSSIYSFLTHPHIPNFRRIADSLYIGSTSGICSWLMLDRFFTTAATSQSTDSVALEQQEEAEQEEAEQEEAEQEEAEQQQLVENTKQKQELQQQQQLEQQQEDDREKSGAQTAETPVTDDETPETESEFAWDVQPVAPLRIKSRLESIPSTVSDSKTDSSEAKDVNQKLQSDSSTGSIMSSSFKLTDYSERAATMSPNWEIEEKLLSDISRLYDVEEDEEYERGNDEDYFPPVQSHPSEGKITFLLRIPRAKLGRLDASVGTISTHPPMGSLMNGNPGSPKAKVVKRINTRDRRRSNSPDDHTQNLTLRKDFMVPLAGGSLSRENSIERLDLLDQKPLAVKTIRSRDRRRSNSPEDGSQNLTLRKDFMVPLTGSHTSLEKLRSNAETSKTNTSSYEDSLLRDRMAMRNGARLLSTGAQGKDATWATTGTNATWTTNSPVQVQKPEIQKKEEKPEEVNLREKYGYEDHVQVHSDDDFDVAMPQRRRKPRRRSSFVAGSRIERFDETGVANKDGNPSQRSRRGRRMGRRRAAQGNTEMYAEWKIDLMVNGYNSSKGAMTDLDRL